MESFFRVMSVLIIAFSVVALPIGLISIINDIIELSEFKEMNRREKFFDREKETCCGTCRHHASLAITDGEWVCMNKDSDYYSIETEWQDYCPDYERRE